MVSLTGSLVLSTDAQLGLVVDSFLKRNVDWLLCELLLLSKRFSFEELCVNVVAVVSGERLRPAP